VRAALSEALETAIKKKIAKQYSSRSWLVVYLNLSEYGIRQRKTEQTIGALAWSLSGRRSDMQKDLRGELAQAHPSRSQLLLPSLGPSSNLARRDAR
jgi:hypothetical protein